MLTCRQFLGALCDYLDGTQDPSACADVEEHLGKCSRCRIVCETTRRTVTLYRTMAVVRPVPAEVESRLLAAIAKRARVEASRGPVR